jgi:WD40 repeat protein
LRPQLVDASGDMLPFGARARMGSQRFRHGSLIHCLAFSPNGQVLASMGLDYTLRLWDYATGQQLRQFTTPEPTGLVSIAFSPDGRLLAMATGRSKVWLWDVASGTELRRFGPINPGIGFVQFSPDGRRLLLHSSPGLGPSNPGLVLMDVATGKQVRQFQPPPAAGNGRKEGPGPLVVWAAQILASLFFGDAPDPVPGNNINVIAAAFSPDGKRLASIESDERPRTIMRLWDPARGRMLRQWRGPDGADRLLYSPDGKILAVSTATDRSAVSLWDAATGKELRSLFRLQGQLTALAFAPDGKRLAVALSNEALVIYDVATGKEIKRLPAPQQGIVAAAFAPDGKTLATGGRGHIIRRWDTVAWKELSAPDGHQGEIRSLFITSDAKRLVTVAVDGTARTWEVASGRALNRLRFADTSTAPPVLNGAAITPDGKALAVALTWMNLSNNRPPQSAIRVWDLASGKLLHKHEPTEFQLIALAAAPGGKMFASASGSSVFHVWDFTSGKQVRQFQSERAENPFGSPYNGATGLAFSPSGKLLATCELDADQVDVVPADGVEQVTNIRLWEVASGKERRRFVFREEPSVVEQLSIRLGIGTEVTEEVIGDFNSGGRPLVFAPDGRTIAVAHGQTIHLCDLASGKEVRRFGGFGVQARTLAFSLDGRLLAAGTSDGAVQFWDVATGTVRGRCPGHRNAVTALAFAADGKALVSGGADTTALVWDVATLLESARERVPALSQERLEQLWNELGSADAAKADQAIRALVAAPRQAVAFLARVLRPETLGTDPRTIAALIAELDSNQFVKREQAMRALERLGTVAEPALRKALATRQPSLEVRRRMERILEQLEGPVTAPEQLRELRALEVLEQIGSAEARQLLAKLAQGTADVPLTQEARAALRRLAILAP